MLYQDNTLRLQIEKSLIWRYITNSDCRISTLKGPKIEKNRSPKFCIELILLQNSIFFPIIKLLLLTCAYIIMFLKNTLRKNLIFHTVNQFQPYERIPQFVQATKVINLSSSIII